MVKSRLALMLAALLAASVASAGSLELRINDRVTTWDTIAVFVMPGETLALELPPDASSSGWATGGGTLAESGPGRADWVAPDVPGLYPLAAVCGPTVKLVNAFVKVPFAELKSGRLNGYRIGRYPKSNPFPLFTVPDGFVEVKPEILDVALSPRYTLRQFVPGRPGGWPAYIALREELILKLELLTDFVIEKGHKCTRLAVMSGYRTPAWQYNEGSGRNSAHIYGGAADVYIDENGDRRLDDLNGDGVSDSKDSRLLAGYADELEQRYPELVGGVGWYRRSRSRTAFVHVDVRGERMRWHE
ncbi:MAG: hypothetical protein R6X12_07130 [bacterium]